MKRLGDDKHFLLTLPTSKSGKRMKTLLTHARIKKKLMRTEGAPETRGSRLEKIDESFKKTSTGMRSRGNFLPRLIKQLRIAREHSDDLTRLRQSETLSTKMQHKQKKMQRTEG